MSAVDDAIRIAREAQPDLWHRTEQVARIIAPDAFEDSAWTIIEPESAARLHEARMKCERAAAMRKAQDVLTFLGVNTKTEWFEILTRMAKESQIRRRG